MHSRCARMCESRSSDSGQAFRPIPPLMPPRRPCARARTTIRRVCHRPSCHPTRANSKNRIPILSSHSAKAVASVLEQHIAVLKALTAGEDATTIGGARDHPDDVAIMEEVAFLPTSLTSRLAEP